MSIIVSEKKIVICTILYKPDLNVINRIKRTAELGYQIYVFDNTPGSTTGLEILKHPLIRTFSFGKNVGIGFSLRLMSATAYYEGFLQLLYFDQDTIYSNITLEYIYKLSTFFLEQKNKALNDFACITFRDFSRKVDGKGPKLVNVEEYSIFMVDFTISSGSLFDLEKLKIAGWHDESFFIDGVDYAVCLSFNRSGFLIGEIGSTPDLDHKTGQDDKNYKIFNYHFRGRRYPAFRVKDYLKSSFKLLSRTVRFSLRKTMWLLRNMIVFVLLQVVVRIIEKKYREK